MPQRGAGPGGRRPKNPAFNIAATTTAKEVYADRCGWPSLGTRSAGIFPGRLQPDQARAAGRDSECRLYETQANNYWDVTTCVFAKELDPAYQGAPEEYDYAARLKPFHLSQRVKRIATDGDIRKPLITLQGTMDALLPINRHARPFRNAVVAAGRASQHRLYEVQNGNHIERYRQSCCNFTQLEFLQPHVHDSFRRLVGWIACTIASMKQRPQVSSRRPPSKKFQ